jgi:hypothetical protein
MNEDNISAAFTVSVDGEVWTETSNLADAGSEDKVFIVSNGTLTFGDGIHGSQPNAGSQVTVSWSQGGGEAGNTQLTLKTSWPPPNVRYQISAASNQIQISPIFACTEQSFGEKRPRYFDGELLTAETFQAEQQYFRYKLRRHNRFLHGQGIVTGLELDASQDARSTCLVISPGYAISPEGEELILTQSLHLAITSQRSPQYVTLQYAERETDPIIAVGSDATAPSRIEDRVLICLVPENETPGALTIGRILLGDLGWLVDRTFQPPLTRCS